MMNIPSTYYDSFRALPRGSHILVAFSGGVDSSVTAYLALHEGYRVTAIRMVLFPDDNPENTEQANKTASHLGIPLHTVYLAEQFSEKVLRPCWQKFKSGITPNPCAICNPKIKFGMLLPYLDIFGCDAFATGHYARIYTTESGPILARGSFRPKDQSYFLSGLSQNQIKHVVFPLGNMSKDEVKSIAKDIHLPCSNAKESQDACFMPPDKTAAGFLKDFFAEETPQGSFRSFPDGRFLGKHAGIWNYTIGQRKGTGIAMGVPAWINHIEQQNNTVWITTREDDLLSSGCTTSPANWIIQPTGNKISAQVQIRYRSKPVDASVQIMPDNSTEITFSSPVRAVTPGQIAAFYHEDILLGGAQIVSACGIEK